MKKWLVGAVMSIGTGLGCTFDPQAVDVGISTVMSVVDMLKYFGFITLIAIALVLPMGCAENRAHVAQVVAYTEAGFADNGYEYSMAGTADLSGATRWSPFGLTTMNKSSLTFKATKVRDSVTPDLARCPYLSAPEIYTKVTGIEQVARDGIYLIAAGSDLGQNGTIMLTLDPSGDISWSPFGISVVNKSSLYFDTTSKSTPKTKDKCLCPWLYMPEAYPDAYKKVTTKPAEEMKK